MEVATVIPVKAFSQAKQRLSESLDDEQRARLARWMAERVVAASAGTTVHIACDDPVVRQWAESLGVGVCWGPGLGLDGAVDDAVARAIEHGAEHVVVSHADLPLARHLGAVVRPGWATVVPDARLDGTNVMSFPADRPIPAGFGPGSFRRHLDRARRTGPTEVRRDPLLALDVDERVDLVSPELRKVLPTWLPTIPANHRSR